MQIGIGGSSRRHIEKRGSNGALAKVVGMSGNLLAGNNLLAGKTAIVTGSGQNIGRAIALCFATAGASVVINGHRDPAKIEAVAEEVRQRGSQALSVLADVGDPTSVRRLVDETRERFGSVDIAVSNVSVRQAGARG